MSMEIASCEGRLGVGPDLDLGPDCFVRVGGDDDPVPAEVEVVQLAVGVVALEGRRVGFTVGVPCRAPAVCGVQGGCCEEGLDAGVEPGDAGVPVGDVADDFSVGVLVHDLRGVGLLCLLHGLVCFTCGYVRDTSEGVRYDDCLDDRVERRCVRNRLRQVAVGGLGGCSILEICHFRSLPFFSLLFFSSRGPL